MDSRVPMSNAPIVPSKSVSLACVLVDVESDIAI